MTVSNCLVHRYDFSLSGWLVDHTGGYTVVFLLFGLVQIAGGLFILGIAVLHKFKPVTI